MDLLAPFIYFFAVIDPIGSVPVFIAVTDDLDARQQRRAAGLATLVATGVLLFFVVAGEIVLDAMDIPLQAFQIAGGLVLFLFALTMIFGESKPEKELKLAPDPKQLAIFPLAVPSIAGPGAMLAAVLLTENETHGIWEQAQVTLAMLAVLLITYVLLLGAGRIHRLIGTSGASIVSRVMGLMLAAVAVAQILDGIKGYFGL